MSKPWVLINGVGTVGVRAADILDSMGLFELVLAKHGANPSKRTTQNLLRLKDRYKGSFEIHASPGEDADFRVQEMRRVLGTCSGVLDDTFHWKGIDVVVDGSGVTPEIVRANAEQYTARDLLFAINGGDPPEIVGHNYFAAVPGLRSWNNRGEVLGRNAKIVSCNSHAVGRAMGLLNVLFAKYGPQAVRHVSAIFNRRYSDPGSKEPDVPFIDTIHGAYHKAEIEQLVGSSIRGKHDMKRRKLGVQHFHTVDLSIAFDRQMSPDFFREYVANLRDDAWAIYLARDEFSQTILVEAAASIGIEDGDLPFAAYHVVPWESGYGMEVTITNPQQGIVAPSTAAWVAFQTLEDLTSVREAVDLVTQKSSWQGQPLETLASRVQQEYATRTS